MVDFVRASSALHASIKRVQYRDVLIPPSHIVRGDDFTNTINILGD